MKRIQITCISLIFLFATACGQPGPLYLPKKEPPVQTLPDEKSEPTEKLAAPPENAVPESETPKDPSQ